jgi:cell division protein FtsB
MTSRKCLLALWLSIAVYSAASVTIGPAGIFAYHRAGEGLERLRVNMEELKAINRGLEGTMDALRYDSDTIMVYARELGYGDPDERFIRIVGLPSTAKKRISAGQLMLYTKPDTVSDRFLRVFSLSLGALVFMVLSVFDYLKKRSFSENSQAGTVLTGNY